MPIRVFSYTNHISFLFSRIFTTLSYARLIEFCITVGYMSQDRYVHQLTRITDMLTGLILDI
jgi:hypothetical protein